MIIEFTNGTIKQVNSRLSKHCAGHAQGPVEALLFEEFLSLVSLEREAAARLPCQWSGLVHSGWGCRIRLQGLGLRV